MFQSKTQNSISSLYLVLEKKKVEILSNENIKYIYICLLK